MRGSRGGQGVRTPPPPKKYKNKGNTGPDPWKITKLPSQNLWAIIGPPAKRHLMAFRWWADDGLLLVLVGSSVPIKKKKKEKILSEVGPPLKWICVCKFLILYLVCIAELTQFNSTQVRTSKTDFSKVRT